VFCVQYKSMKTLAGVSEVYRVAALISPGKDTGSPLALSNMFGGVVVQSAAAVTKANLARWRAASPTRARCSQRDRLRQSYRFEALPFDKTLHACSPRA
jgi:hypothetical protein